MIVSHNYRFIFIKTRKTAGSSVEIALSRLCQEGDIVTPLSFERGEENIRQKEGGYGPTGHKKPIWAHKGLKGWRKLLKKGRKSYSQHMIAKKVRRLVGTKVWNNYLKISIERNPWDRALSRYYWEKHRWEKKGRADFPNISEFLRWAEKNMPLWLTNWEHYTIQNEIAVDRVMLYENLTHEMQNLSRMLGVDENILCLPNNKLKGGFRKEKRPYWEVFTDHDRVLIERNCLKEIEAFDYHFI